MNGDQWITIRKLNKIKLDVVVWCSVCVRIYSEYIVRTKHSSWLICESFDVIIVIVISQGQAHTYRTYK